MILAGLRKLSLLDFPGKTCCTVFTLGCNFRCPFCHNGSLVVDLDNSPRVSEEDFFAYLIQRKKLLEGVCVTGGEPLIHPDIECFLQKIKDLGYLVKLDTNGSFPDKLKNLIKKDLCDFVAMDIKASKDGYLRAIGLSDFEYLKIERSIDILLKGNVPYEFRTTVVKEIHSDDDFKTLAQRIKGAPRYTLQSFVNSDDVINKKLNPCTQEEIERFASYFRGNVGEIVIK